MIAVQVELQEVMVGMPVYPNIEVNPLTVKNPELTYRGRNSDWEPTRKVWLVITRWEYNEGCNPYTINPTVGTAKDGEIDSSPQHAELPHQKLLIGLLEN